MEQAIKIRPAVKKDLPVCEKLGKIKEFHVSTEDYFESVYLGHYLDKNFFLVAEKNNLIVGLIIAEAIKAKGVFVWYLTVAPAERGQGIGEKLIKEVEKNCRKLKKEWIVLYCPDDNKKSKNFYKKAGYIGQQRKLVEFEKIHLH